MILPAALLKKQENMTCENLNDRKENTSPSQKREMGASTQHKQRYIVLR